MKKQQQSCRFALLLLFLGSFFSSAVMAQSLWEQSGPEDMIVSVYANNQPIMGTLYALYDRQLYIPLSELATELGLPVTLDRQQRQVLVTAAYRLPSYRLYLLDDGRLRVEQTGQEDRIWPAEAWLSDLWGMEGELYLSAAYMEQLWPITFDFNLNRLRLDLRTEEPLPELEARARQRLRELRLRQLERDELTSPGLPYALASPPLVEWNARYQSDNRRENYGLIARHDLLGFGHEWQAQINNNRFRDEYQLTRLRWTGSYYAAESGSPEPLFGGVQQLEVGDLRTQALQGTSSATQGRGIFLSSFTDGQRSVFATQVITGFAPVGWEADLYINQQLVDYQVIGDTGTYEFEAFLQQGYNRVEVRLFGALGEERIDRFNFQLGQDYLERGEFAASFATFQPERDLLGLEDERIRAPHQPDLITQVDLGIGISPSLNLRGHWRNQQFQDDFNETSANQLGWTLGGMQGLWSWEWQQLFEESEYFSRLEAQYSTSNAMVSLALLEHPEWPAYRREGVLSERQYQLRSHYQLTPLRYLPLRLGFNAKREEYSSYLHDQLELTQQWRLYRWAFNLNQRCSFYDGTLQDFCSFEHSTRYSHLGLRASLDTTSDYQHDGGWSQHQWRAQAYYDLNRLSQNSHWQDWMQRFQVRGQYGQTHFSDANRDTDRRWLYELTWRKTLRYMDIGWSVGREDTRGWNVSLQLSGNLLPGLGGYQAIGEKLHRPTHIQAYYDTNYDGRFNRGEEVAENIALRQRSRSSHPADEKGQIWLNLVPNTELDLDLRSVQDPYIVSGRSAFRLASRPERVTKLYWPLIETGALDGELLSPEGRALINQRIELRRMDQSLVQTIFTAFDGFWAFEFVPPGEYEIHWVQTDDSALLAQVRLSPDNLWVSLMDLDVNQPLMLAAALAEQPEIPEQDQLIQRSSRHAFLVRAIEKNYTYLGSQQEQALVFDHLHNQVRRLNPGDLLGDQAVQLVQFSPENAVFALSSGHKIELLPAYRLIATQQLNTGDWVADLHWKDTRPSSLLPYDRVREGTQLYASGQVIQIERNRVVLQWQNEQLILDQAPRAVPLSASSRAQATPLASIQNQAGVQRLTPEQLKAIAQSAWTLQIMSSNDEAAVQRFVQQHASLNGLAYYRRAHNSHPWVVIYGTYPNQAAAEAARQALPQALRSTQPWPRSYSSLNAEISE